MIQERVDKASGYALKQETRLQNIYLYDFCNILCNNVELQHITSTFSMKKLILQFSNMP